MSKNEPKMDESGFKSHYTEVQVLRHNPDGTYAVREEAQVRRRQPWEDRVAYVVGGFPGTSKEARSEAHRLAKVLSG